MSTAARPALSRKREQCRVYSRRRKLNTDLSKQHTRWRRFSRHPVQVAYSMSQKHSPAGVTWRRRTTELYISWSELSRRKLSPTLATAHYCPDDAIWLVAQCELSGYVKLGYRLEAVGRKFSHGPGNSARAGVVRWSSAHDIAGPLSTL